ncbi:hypothetical protein, partial [Aquabacterium sp.]|uniref:hypothetical protein n=1 Tax=Aquabacterium sp. TaxID=1872578 RepID=UPI002486E185
GCGICTSQPDAYMGLQMRSEFAHSWQPLCAREAGPDNRYESVTQVFLKTYFDAVQVHSCLKS